MRRLFIATTGVFFGAGTSACLIPQIERFEYIDRGEACLVHVGADDLEAELHPGEELEIVVFFPHGCLSSSCSDVRKAVCTATLAGDEIRIESHGIVEEDVSAAQCTEDCAIMAARCPIALETAGEYTLVHGEQTRVVELPGEPRCAGGF